MIEVTDEAIHLDGRIIRGARLDVDGEVCSLVFDRAYLAINTSSVSVRREFGLETAE